MIRTVKEYLDSLRDGRVVYCSGERVRDVTAHPILSSLIRAGAIDYYLANEPKHHDLFVAKNEEGEDVSFLTMAPRCPEDLVRRREILSDCVRTGMGTGTFAEAVAMCELDAATLVSGRMDKQLGTNYTERVEDYRRYLQKTDFSIAGAVTDAKGDRSLRPSKQVQHKDYYVRVVDRQKDGVIVRGAKMHITAAVCSNEVMVMPCRTHGEEDKDYAVMFATPLNAKGIILIAGDPPIRVTGEEARWDWPVTATQGVPECMIIFDDVFVPWERVLMCGEWQFSRPLVYAFGTSTRLLADIHMVGTAEMLVGVASLMAKYNGLEKSASIRDKLAWLVMYSEATDVIGKVSCQYPDREPDSDLVSPSAMYSNVAKFISAEYYNEAIKIASDICGGILTTGHNYRDWMNPEISPWLEKYFSSKDGIPTEYRLRAVRLMKDLTSFNPRLASAMHADGSLAAQRMAIYSAADWERYEAAAKRAARIPGWEKDPYFGSLPDYPNCVLPEFPPIDTSYRVQQSSGV